ncbi:hypothetical protein G8E10_04895 [Rhizobiaceae bacterium CRRU44]|uniref:Uncharacterized protein n=1 Tax=Ferranicluibacter rubi TaxID=2715133 RepID=A0AA44C9Q3_9HYPH|nr:hypothetical protein [Ferranicluibacter rubi]NHT75094.1 hypothetical protein [Ferranicluibacter rubi]
MSLDYDIRLYELLPDGKLEALGGGSLQHFAGSCPNVGDAIARYNVLEGTFKFYNVQRRMFIDSADGDEGWAIVIRRTDASPLTADVADEWLDETKFWRDVDEQERREEQELAERTPGTAEWLKKQREERNKFRPRLGLNGSERGVLYYMLRNRTRKTIDRIVGAGEKRMKKLAGLGLVEPGATNARGELEWRVTKAGKAELKRHETFRDWKQE